MQNRLVFERTRLEEVTEELERCYDIAIVVPDTNLAKETVTCTFDSLPLEKALYSLCATLDKKLERLNGEYIIK
jgi:ferric-dicitrate binding protein FerR (iron transport regulator)